MKKNWKLTGFTAAIIIALLACSLPGMVNPQPTDTPLPPPDVPPADQPDSQPQPEPQDEPESEEPPEAEEPAEEEPTVEPEPTSDPEAGCIPDSEFIDDVSIPDGTLVNPGSTITKTWRIQNDGTCTWTGEFVWVQLNYDDSKLQASMEEMPLPIEVAPGETYDISVELTLDGGAAIGSRHTAKFQMRSPGGDLFGTHPFSTIFAAPGTGVCPIGTVDQATFINVAERFCFLYPKDHNAYIGATGSTVVNHPGSGSGNEDIVASVSITNQGSAGGLNTTDWADDMVDAWKVPATNPPVKNVDIGGMTGRYCDELPGMVGNRIAFLVHNGDGFTFTILPWDDAFPVKKEQARDLWNLIRSEFTFFGP